MLLRMAAVGQLRPPCRGYVIYSSVIVTMAFDARPRPRQRKFPFPLSWQVTFAPLAATNGAGTTTGAGDRFVAAKLPPETLVTTTSWASFRAEFPENVALASMTPFMLTTTLELPGTKGTTSLKRIENRIQATF